MTMASFLGLSAGESGHSTAVVVQEDGIEVQTSGPSHQMGGYLLGVLCNRSRYRAAAEAELDASSW